jgi:hypothetical protein
MEEEIKVIKIENPEYIGVIAPFINGFLEKVAIPGVTYESLYTFLSQTVQMGQAQKHMGLRDTQELWVVLDGKKPLAFARWFVMGLPYLGCVSCDIIYSWNRKAEPVKLLIEKFRQFSYDHRSPMGYIDAHNEALFKVFKKYAEEYGYEVNRTEKVNFTVRKA